MAKRKRLTPAQQDYLGTAEPQGLPEGGLETKAFPLGVAPTRSQRPPIAQVAGDTAAAAALGEVTAEMARARAEGRLIQALPLDQIATDYLVRDRLAVDEGDLLDLVQSLKARGQQTPIEVVDLGPGALPRYGLISGWRRVAALKRLAEAVPALAVIRSPDTAAQAYVAMVEENEIRVGLSYYERARIVVKACDQGIYGNPREALQDLFANVSRTKRSKIKSFMTVVTALDGVLRFPAAIGERAGLDLAKRLEDPVWAEALAQALRAAPAETAEAEREMLAEVLAPQAAGEAPAPAPSVTAPFADQSAGQRPAQALGGAPKMPARKALDPVALTRTADRIELTGPGVDDALAEDLAAWLRKRGYTHA